MSEHASGVQGGELSFSCVVGECMFRIRSQFSLYLYSTGFAQSLNVFESLEKIRYAFQGLESL